MLHVSQTGYGPFLHLCQIRISSFCINIASLVKNKSPLWKKQNECKKPWLCSFLHHFCFETECMNTFAYILLRLTCFIYVQTSTPHEYIFERITLMCIAILLLKCNTLKATGWVFLVSLFRIFYLKDMKSSKNLQKCFHGLIYRQLQEHPLIDFVRPFRLWREQGINMKHQSSFALEPLL